MPELSNIFTEGTQGLMVDGSLKYIPMNEDAGFVGKITAYNATTGKVTLQKAWTKATTPETFYAIAKYYGLSGIPTSDEVVAGAYAPVFRVGVGNNDWSDDSAFQLRDSTNTTKPSFVCFFFS